MKYNKDERRAINEANRAINEAVKAKEKVERAQKERVAREHAARIAREASRLRQEEAARAARRLSEAERIARAQQDFEARVDAFTAAIAEVLKDQDLKLLGGWTTTNYLTKQATYSGTVVELASTTSEHKAIIRVQIGQGLKR